MVMYTLNICFEDIIEELKKYHKVFNTKLMRRAYNYANEKHKNQKPRKTGEPYINHPLRVARLVASWGFEEDIISAALLHDTLEDTDATLQELETSFGKNVADMVEAVTSISKDIRDKAQLTKEEIDALSDKHLKEKMSEKALFIKTADRIDNLKTIDPFPEAQKLAKATHTREIIIPMLMKEDAYMLIDVLEDLCLRIEHPKQYEEIVSKYKALRDENAYTTTKTLNFFSEVFSPNYSPNSDKCRTALGSIVKFTHHPRSAISVYRQINSLADNITTDLSKLLCKKNIVMYDLTLVIRDDCCFNTTPSNVFFILYSNLLTDKNITIVDVGQTTYKNSKYYILSDEMDNLYRLFVKSETEYMRYMLGCFIDNDTEDVTDFGTAIDGKKIKVYTRNSSAIYIESGATFLDFAFAIHSEIGLHFSYATVDGSETHRKLSEKVNEGDIISIWVEPAVKPDFTWFRHAKTHKAINELIKYFSANYKKC